jgi:hypothetical protein
MFSLYILITCDITLSTYNMIHVFNKVKLMFMNKTDRVDLLVNGISKNTFKYLIYFVQCFLKKKIPNEASQH